MTSSKDSQKFFFDIIDGVRNIIEKRQNLYGSQILWFGNSFGKDDSGTTPTYIFPSELRTAIKKRFPDPDAGAMDDEYETRQGVHHVSIEELRSMKWPAVPKSCTKCKRGKPY